MATSTLVALTRRNFTPPDTTLLSVRELLALSVRPFPHAECLEKPRQRQVSQLFNLHPSATTPYQSNNELKHLVTSYLGVPKTGWKNQRLLVGVVGTVEATYRFPWESSVKVCTSNRWTYPRSTGWRPWSVEMNVKEMDDWVAWENTYFYHFPIYKILK